MRKRNYLIEYFKQAPRWLLQNEYRDEAVGILTQLNTHKGVLDDNNLEKTVTEITEAIALESHQASWMDLLNSDRVGSRRRVVLSCILNACQAWSGSTPVSYYTTYM